MQIPKNQQSNPISRIFNIITNDETSSLVPGVIHTLSSSDSDKDSTNDQASNTSTTTASGRTIRKPVYTSVYSSTSDDGKIFVHFSFYGEGNLYANLDETIHLAWDYEDDLELLGVLYARQIEGRHPSTHLTLDLVDSRSGKRLRRIKLDPKIRISSFEETQVFLRLDADLCIISISRSSLASIILFRFTSSSTD